MGADLDELLREAETAHGHLCAGQVLGVRMAILALRRLGIDDPRKRTLADGSLNPDRKRLVTFVEIDRCATDAIGVVTGCRVGKRALVTHVDPDIYHAFKIEAARRGLTTDLLMHIALARVFDDFNVPAQQALCDKLQAALAQAKRHRAD